MYMYVDYNDVAISHTCIENNLHKQQCTTSLLERINTMHFLKIICIICLQALMNVGYAHTKKLFDYSWKVVG